MSNTSDEIAPLAAFTRIGHAFFSRDGVKLAFGRTWDGTLIHISQAKRGAACGCYCPAESCRRKLIARRPETDLAHHFAHTPLTKAERAAGVSPRCAYGPMTQLHAYAEKLLSERKSLKLGAVEATLDGRRKTFRKSDVYNFDMAKLETMDGETIPDVILWKGNHRMHVEIFVTHRCGPEKRAKIVAGNISALEIDLSGVPRDSTVEVVNDAILKSAPREWIHNRKRQKLLAVLQAEAEDEAARKEAKRRKQIADLSVAYADAERSALASNWKDSASVSALLTSGFGNLLDGPKKGAGYFLVHPKVWKAVILNEQLRQIHGSNIDSIIYELDRMGWINKRFHPSDDDELLADAKLPSKGAKGAVLSYLHYLEGDEVAEDQGWTWTYSQRHKDEISRRKREKELAAHEAIRRATRHKGLADLVKQIIDLASHDQNTSFKFDDWLTVHTTDLSRSVKEIADEGQGEWHTLTKQLSTILAVLKDEFEGETTDCGLSICKSLEAARIRHQAKAIKRLREAEEIAKQERDARVHILIQAATAAFGDDHSHWLDIPRAELNWLTPRAAAEASPEQLAKAHSLLRHALAALALKERWVDELKREASDLLRRPDMVDLYLSSGDPKLPGGGSPEAYTKDEPTMRECLALLKKRHRKR